MTTILHQGTNSRGGFSILEVMIAVAILSTVLAVLAGNIYTLSTARTMAKESAIANEILRGMIERIQGADFSTLGQANINRGNLGAWSWHRRVKARPPALVVGNVPMTETIPTAAIPALANETNVLPFVNCLIALHDTSSNKTLITPGLLQEPSGLSDLKVYLEYYRESVIVDELATSTTPLAALRNICNSTGPYANQNGLIFPDDNTMNPNESGNSRESGSAAILVRVVVTWTSRASGTNVQMRELSVARRQ